MPTSPRSRAVAVATAAVLLSLAACGDDVKGDDTDLTAQKLSWKTCEAPSESEGGGTAPSPLPDGDEWQCATMKAPLDWDEPDGDTIGIALIRARTSGARNRRIGSLVFNFGGPGGSGVKSLPASAQDYATLRTRYDLVSFDPRGVGRSAGVRCEDDEQLDEYFQQDGTPDDAAERRKLLDTTKSFNSACEENSGKTLPHVRTTDAARDMDLMRQVLGDDELHYFGISYGTELGGVYAHLFPRKVGRAVFDAVVDPTQTSEQGTLGQAGGFQLALDNYARDCVSKTEDCPVGDSEQDVENRITKLLDDLDARPIDGIFPRDLTQTIATSGIAQALYSQDLWPYLTQGLELAYEGDGSLLMSLSDSMNGRSENGEYSNLTAANVSINCADSAPRYTTADVEDRLGEFEAASPVFGDWLAWSLLACTDWAVAGAADHPDVRAPGAAPILVIGNTGDPATPYEGARKMVEALGAGVGIELTYRGQGHGAYNSGNTCVQKAVDGYLLKGKTPKAGTVCT
ncbi:alpha/beta hydrolase [Streptomyces sp. LBUM 1478]|uniref:Putative peptidase n=1 Tax=Streptomyces scabiei (strain 87.22) TaxID=680198 RepID=C9ZBS5_STRSW|nr:MULTISPECIES: alpha/beta fold hydrolase [Streptomyces]MBP5908192.1 alpha/beta hydrolase [Streptomyces sp. LBUM 1478]MBP5928798.1 alpha/beta hydrolase [Streptomyces sp. LBUM 1479]MBP5891152.1 alpha/beta hydrolase [Streptomyces sp. LBUM 1481]MBP5921306.1 alpha/beta hydrolase [Streptomyces sp. LBUM 1483]MDX2581431.1 alpha/beta fold hydrolase [Streptomyces scabiei]